MDNDVRDAFHLIAVNSHLHSVREHWRERKDSILRLGKEEINRRKSCVCQESLPKVALAFCESYRWTYLEHDERHSETEWAVEELYLFERFCHQLHLWNLHGYQFIIAFIPSLLRWCFVLVSTCLVEREWIPQQTVKLGLGVQFHPGPKIGRVTVLHPNFLKLAKYRDLVCTRPSSNMPQTCHVVFTKFGFISCFTK